MTLQETISNFSEACSNFSAVAAMALSEYGHRYYSRQYSVIHEREDIQTAMAELQAEFLQLQVGIDKYLAETHPAPEHG